MRVEAISFNYTKFTVIDVIITTKTILLVFNCLLIMLHRITFDRKEKKKHYPSTVCI